MKGFTNRKNFSLIVKKYRITFKYTKQGVDIIFRFFMFEI